MMCAMSEDCKRCFHQVTVWSFNTRIKLAVCDKRTHVSHEQNKNTGSEVLRNYGAVQF